MTNREWRERRKAEGKCCTCSVALPPPGKRQCLECQAKRRARERKRYAEGLCGCGKPRPEGKAKCEDCKARHAKWMAIPANKKRWQQKVNENNRVRRIKVLEHYGAKCVCCGEDGLPFLTLDHINSDGAKDRAEVFSGYWWRWVIKQGYPKHLQVMCWNCNMAKQHFGNGVCPHQVIHRKTSTLQPG